MKKHLIIIASLLVSLTSFGGFGANSSKHNDEISPELRNKIHKLNKTIIKGLSAGSIDQLKDVKLSSSISLSDLEQLQKQLGAHISGKNFTVFNDYHSKYVGFGKTTFPIPSQTELPFTILLELKNNEPCFVSLMKTDGEFNEIMLTFTYVKDGDSWLLQGLHGGNYGIAGRNAVQWYEEAKSIASKKHNLPALLRLQMATSSILRPAPHIQYEKEKEILGLAQSLQSELAAVHKFPMTLSEISTSPVIYYITPEFVQNDLFPQIKYVTKHSLDDKDALKQEADEMMNALRKLFPGIADYYEHLVFKAFSEPPTNPQRAYKAYGTIVNVNEFSK